MTVADKKRAEAKRAKERVVEDLVDALAKLIDVETFATLLNDTLCAESEASITDEELVLVEAMFDRITRTVPNVAAIAMGLQSK